MIQARLDSIQENAARIAIEYTNGRVDAHLTGKKTSGVDNECLRVTYLWAVINNIYLVGETPYIGGTATTDEYVFATRDKLWHYSGFYDWVDLSAADYDAITPDDGDGGVVDPTAPTDNDHYRSASVSVNSGVNIITFMKDGVPSPLPSADYTVVMWATLTDGSIQRNLVPSTKTASGFVVTDVLSSGILEYQATLDT